jgi:hypothetical protein
MHAIIYIVGVLTLALVVWWLWKFTSSVESYTGLGDGKAINGGDLPNNPVEKGKISTANDCRAKCATTNGCTHFTWLGPNAIFPNTCWLKRADGGGEVQNWTDSYSGAVGDPIQVQELPKPDPGQTPPIVPGSCPDPGCDVIVSEHNRVRAAHGVHEKLRWDTGLQAIAQARANWNADHAHLGKTGHDAVASGIAPSAGPENAYSGIGFGTGPGGAAEMWANSLGHAPHVLGRNVTAVGCATNPGAGSFPSLCVYDAWGKICGDPTICTAPSNNCRCENGWGCC